MSESDFDPTKIGDSSEEELPKKREASEKTKNVSKLPDPVELLNAFKKEPKPKVQKKVWVKKKEIYAAVISKPAALNKSQADDIEQFDYFASQSTAILTNWKAAPELPDKDQIPDRAKFIKKLNAKQKPDMATQLERELLRRERAKSGKKR